MLHFSKQIFMISMLSFAVAAFAQSAKIAPERVEVFIKQYLQQSEKDLSDDEIKQYRKILTDRLQKAEILQDEALALGLDKKPDVQLQLKNNLAMFYADHYVDYLNQNIVVDELSLKQFYLSTQREVKLQIASFASQKEAIEAHNKLKKGMSFKDLLNSLAKQMPFPSDFVSLGELPSSIGAEALEMEKGQISNKPIEYQDTFYLLKIVDMRMPSDLQAFEELDPKVKANIIESKKQMQVMDKLDALYKKHGLIQ